MTSHNRCCLVEVMGRNAGYLALNIAVATGAETALIPEKEFDFDRDIIEELSLELPIYHLCNEDCPGLCSVCGKKLDGACKCSQEKEIDPRLEIFKKLLDNSEK